MSSDAAVSVDDRTMAHGRITICRYLVSALESTIPSWPELDKRGKLAAISLLDGRAALFEQTVSNIVCRGQHELLAEYLSRTSTPDETAAYLAVGDDNSTAPAYDNTSLNNERYRTQVTDSSVNGTTVESVVFLDATEANEMDAVREMGLVTHATAGEGRLLSHALVDPEPKSSDTAITIYYDLSWTLP